MLYFDRANRTAIESPTNEQARTLETRNDWRTIDAAREVAALLNANPAAVGLSGDLIDPADGQYVATDAGEHTSPRFDVVRAPAIGDPVSYRFNGDCYPAGHVARISRSLRVVETDTGVKFYRCRETGSWIRTGGTFALTHGHHSYLNPSF